jgi:hypothetical protein
LVEAFSGQDGKQRRYYINNQGVLNYALADSTTAPTYATAPYKLITTGVANYDTNTAAATVYPNSMSAAWDHHTTKNVSVTTAASGGSTQTGMVLYTSANFAARPGAPILDDRVESPTTAATTNVKSVKRIGTAFLVERFKPILTVTFTLRGGGTTSWNRIGWGSGYYQTGASTFALQSKWAPGQWVSVTCAELGLSGLYRVEQVDFKFEPGSFTGLWTITANRRSSTGLVQQILKGSRK